MIPAMVSIENVGGGVPDAPRGRPSKLLRAKICLRRLAAQAQCETVSLYRRGVGDAAPYIVEIAFREDGIPAFQQSAYFRPVKKQYFYTEKRKKSIYIYTSLC